MRLTSAARRGFTIVELVIVMAILGIMAAVAVPRLRRTPLQEADGEARRLLQSLELARTRAYAARAAVLVVVDDSTVSFHLDADRDSTFTESATERDAFGSGAVVRLAPAVTLVQGGTGAVPGDTVAARAAGTVQRWRLDPRGVPEPFGTTFTLYVTHRDESLASAAVTMTAAGNTRPWRYTAGGWR